MEVYIDSLPRVSVELGADPQTDVTVSGNPETDVTINEEEKIGIEVEQEEPVDVKIDGQIYEVGGGNGQDGFSPIVEVEEIEGGHRVTITDIEGIKTFDVLDGKNGEDGQDGRDGVDGYTPVKGVDYFTDSDKKEISQEISSTYDVNGNGQVDKADDSDKLGGQLPSYYATKEQLKSKADLVDGKVPLSQLPDNIGGGSGETPEIAWEDIKNKPFYEDKAFDDIVWDGNTDGLPMVSADIDTGEGGIVNLKAYKVSDVVIPMSSMNNVTVQAMRFGEYYEEQVDQENLIELSDNGSYFDGYDLFFFCITEDNTVADLSEFLGIVLEFPESGLWLTVPEQMGEEMWYVTTIAFQGVLKQIDPKFLPDQLPKVTESDRGKFLCVDDNGEWVATAMSKWTGGWY